VSEHLREHSCSLPLYIRSVSHGPWSAGRCCMCLRSQSLVHFTAVTIGNAITQEAVAGRVEQAAEERNQRPRKWGWDSVDRVMERRDSLHWRKLCTVLENYKRSRLGALKLNHSVFIYLLWIIIITILIYIFLAIKLPVLRRFYIFKEYDGTYKTISKSVSYNTREKLNTQNLISSLVIIRFLSDWTQIHATWITICAIMKLN
jgi:hypothetical protein